MVALSDNFSMLIDTEIPMKLNETPFSYGTKNLSYHLPASFSYMWLLKHWVAWAATSMYK